MIERAEIIRDKGTNRRQFFRGQVDKYTWVDVGSSYVPSEICSAFLFAQLEMLDVISERRRAIYSRYQVQLAPLEEEGFLSLPHVPAECTSNYHLFYVLLPDAATRDGLMLHLRKEGILAVFHYIPLHSSPMGREVGKTAGPLPVTDSISGRLLRLPMYYDLSEEDQMRVVEAIRSYVQSVRASNAGRLVVGAGPGLGVMTSSQGAAVWPARSVTVSLAV